MSPQYIVPEHLPVCQKLSSSRRHLAQLVEDVGARPSLLRQTIVHAEAFRVRIDLAQHAVLQICHRCSPL